MSHVLSEQLQRLAALEELKRRVEADITAIKNGLIVAGHIDARGRRYKPPTHTDTEAKEAHAAHQRGERSDWIDAGERQYQREKKRATRPQRRYAA